MKLFGLAATLWMIGGTSYLLWRVETNPKSTISQHAALSKKSQLYFAAYFVPGALAINYFLAVWFVPMFSMSQYWVLVLIVASICDVILGVIPDTEGWQKFIHQLTAYSAAILSMFFTFAIAVNSNVSLPARIFSFASSFFMISTVLIFALHIKKHRLVLQSTYILFFYLSILIATFL